MAISSRILLNYPSLGKSIHIKIATSSLSRKDCQLYSNFMKKFSEVKVNRDNPFALCREKH